MGYERIQDLSGLYFFIAVTSAPVYPTRVIVITFL